MGLLAVLGCCLMACGEHSLEGVYPVPDDLYAATAIGSDHLWTSGYFGAVYRTTDGGETWDKLKMPTQKSIYDISFADERHGWAVGRRGFLIHTTDGGDTWEFQELPRKPARHIFAIHAVTKDHVWAVGDWGGRYATNDGGKTWVDHSFRIDESHPSFYYLTDDELKAFERGDPIYDDIYLNDVYFVDDTRGWIVGEYGLIYRTDDAGETWTKSEIVGAVRFDDIMFPPMDAEIPRDLWPELFAASEILMEKEYLKLRLDACLTPEEFKAAGGLTTLSDDRAEELRDFLESEGISQDRIRIINPTPFDEEGVDMDAFRKSKLCDQPHVSIEVVETPFLFDVKFTPEGEGLIAGLGGVILQSKDDGLTWRYLEGDSRQAFFAVGIGSNSLVAVGEKGLKRVSLDHGATWKAPDQGFPRVVSFMRDLVFGTPERGWIVGADNIVLRSSDGGLTWEHLQVQSESEASEHEAGVKSDA
jgi:photosystem II stability/assembly factor-like uncharacterized protein